MSVFEFFEMDGGDSDVLAVRSRLSGGPEAVGGVCVDNEDSSPCGSHASRGEGPDDERLEDVLSELRAEAGLDLDVRAEHEDILDLQGEELSWDANRPDVTELEDRSNTSHSTASPERHAPSTGDGEYTHTHVCRYVVD